PRDRALRASAPFVRRLPGRGGYLRGRSMRPTRSSIASSDQPARDHLRLYLCRTLEDIEDARVAQDAADFIFQCVAVAAVDLQAGVGVRPGGAGAEQLCHPGFDIAAFAAVLGARGGVAQFARRDEIDKAHREL